MNIFNNTYSSINKTNNKFCEGSRSKKDIIEKRKAKTPLRNKSNKYDFTNKINQPTRKSIINIKNQSYNIFSEFNNYKANKVANSFKEDLSSKRTETKSSLNQSKKSKYSINGNSDRSPIINLKNKRKTNKEFGNLFEIKINKKEDKKQNIKYPKKNDIKKTKNNKKNNENKNQFLYKLSLEQSDNSLKSKAGKVVINYSKDSNSGKKK